MSVPELLRAMAHEELVRLATEAGWTITRSDERAVITNITGDTMSHAPAGYDTSAPVLRLAPAPAGRNRAARRASMRRRNP